MIYFTRTKYSDTKSIFNFIDYPDIKTNQHNGGGGFENTKGVNIGRRSM